MRKINREALEEILAAYEKRVNAIITTSEEIREISVLTEDEELALNKKKREQLAAAKEDFLQRMSIMASIF